MNEKLKEIQAELPPLFGDVRIKVTQFGPRVYVLFGNRSAEISESGGHWYCEYRDLREDDYYGQVCHIAKFASAEEAVRLAKDWLK